MSVQGEGNPSQWLFIAGQEEDDQELNDACDTEHYGILQVSRVLLVLPDDTLPWSSPSTARSVQHRARRHLRLRHRGPPQGAPPGAHRQRASPRENGPLLWQGGDGGRQYASGLRPPADGMDASAVVRQQVPAASGLACLPATAAAAASPCGTSVCFAWSSGSGRRRGRPAGWSGRSGRRRGRLAGWFGGSGRRRRSGWFKAREEGSMASSMRPLAAAPF